MATTTTMKLDDLIVDPVMMQARERLTREAVDQYAEAYTNGEDMPLVTVYKVGDDRYYLTDGFHRMAAMRRIGYLETPVELHEGTLADALRAAAASNATQGIRRTAGDSVRAAKIAIRAFKEAGMKKRPTIDQICEAAKCGRSTAERALEELRNEGVELGEKDRRGRKKKTESTTESTTHRTSQYTSDDGVERDENGEELKGVALRIRQADRRTVEANQLLTSVSANLAGLEPEDLIDGSDVRVRWETVLHMIDITADAIRAALGEPVDASEPGIDSEAADAA